MRRKPSLWVLAAIVLIGLWTWTQQGDNGALHSPGAGSSTTDSSKTGPPKMGTPAAGTPATRGDPTAGYPAFLPPEAHPVLEAIADGGPYKYRQDGGVFQNRERLLPRQPRGYYHEFTIDTPGSRDRGARRVITGGDPPTEYFYTDDHYRSFRRFQWHGARQ